MLADVCTVLAVERVKVKPVSSRKSAADHGPSAIAVKSKEKSAVGASSYVYALSRAALVPDELVTRTSTAPPACAPVVPPTCVASMMVKSSRSTPPKVAPVQPEELTTSMTTAVPPAIAPVSGTMATTSGTSRSRIMPEKFVGSP